MEIRKPVSWDEFRNEIKNIRDRYGVINQGTELEQKNHILFRGHASEGWKLETTLERYSKEEFHLAKYLQAATENVEEIEAYTEKSWSLPDFPNIMKEIKEIEENSSSLLKVPCYEYLVYLRHFGFPSPLLDWSKSPYIAAFFAYSELSDNNPVVYAYVPSIDGCRGSVEGSPRIDIHGPFAKTHKRHFSQKAWYTTATTYLSGRYKFVNHEDIFANDSKEQDILFKIVLPRSIRKQVLLELADYNINYFTIYHNEDSLIKSIAMKVFDLR